MYVGGFAYVSQNVKIGKNTKIYPHVFLGNNVEIGEDTILYSGVKIYDNCTIGSHCVIHANTVLGSDGFGFAPVGNDLPFQKIPQIGNVVIEDYVEIGANSVVDCGTLGSTVLKKGVKLDNLIQIAHNVVVGENTMVAAQTGISGSTKLGKNCLVGGQVGFVGHIDIAEGSKINSQSGVSKTISQPNKSWDGRHLQPFTESMKSQILARNLPKLEQRIRELEEVIRQIKQQQTL